MTVTTASPARTSPGLADSVPVDASDAWSADRWAAWRTRCARWPVSATPSC
jgi:hypothetical protein